MTGLDPDSLYPVVAQLQVFLFLTLVMSVSLSVSVYVSVSVCDSFFLDVCLFLSVSLSLSLSVFSSVYLSACLCLPVSLFLSHSSSSSPALFLREPPLTKRPPESHFHNLPTQSQQNVKCQPPSCLHAGQRAVWLWALLPANGRFHNSVQTRASECRGWRH